MANDAGRTIRRLIFAASLFSFSRMFTGAVYVHELLRNGLTVEDISVAKSLQLLTTALLTLPFGLVADRFGRKRFVLLAYLSSAGAFALLLKPDAGRLLVAEVLTGLAFAAFSGAYEAWLLAEKRGQNAADLTRIFAHSAQATFFAMLIAALVGAYNPNLSFGLSLACMLVTLVVFSFIPDQGGQATDEDAAEIKTILTSTLRELARPGALAAAAFVTVGFTAMMQLLYHFWQAFFEQRFASEPRTLGYVFASFMAAQFVISRALRARSQPFGMQPMMSVGVLSLSGAFLLFGLIASKNVIWAGLMLCLVQASCAGAQIILHSIVGAEVPSALRATTFSMVDLAGRMAGSTVMASYPGIIRVTGQTSFGWPLLAAVLATLGLGTVLRQWSRS